MTRHNLPKHLSWLLNSSHNVPSAPLISISATSPVNLGAEPYSLSHFPSQTIEEPCPTENLDVSTNETNCKRSEEFARPLLPASSFHPRRSESMGRLQSASKSSTRPRLLSSALPELAPDSKQPPSSRSVTSLGVQYNAAYNSGNTSK